MNKVAWMGGIFISLILATSCRENSEGEMQRNILNTFKMTVNGLVWTPTVIDPCHSTFNCNMSALNQDNFYKIEAYKDPLSIASLMSENFFELRIMKANEIGIYIIDETFKDFTNYVRFTKNDTNGKKVYQNKENSISFKVEITEFFLNKNSSVRGIKGSFAGTLYNIKNPIDSIRIDAGEFTFKKTNWYNFNQCKE